MVSFHALYEELLAAYGPQDWWPADDAFEIMLGSVLVQRTAWRNAELALAQLRQHDLLKPVALAVIEPDTLAGLIRSAGFFRVKARRLRRLSEFLVACGGTEALCEWETTRLREALLQLEGVGPETADTILLYAFDRPVVVIDEYLRRLMRRLEPGVAAVADDRLRQAILDDIDDTARLNEFHALVIEHGKQYCARQPRCATCVLRRRCAYGSG